MNITSTKIWWDDGQSDYTYNSSLDVDWFLKFTLNGTKNTIVDLMVYIMWLALMFMLMKSCVVSKTWIWFIDKIMGNLSESLWWKEPWKLWWLLWSVGVIPLRDKDGNLQKVGVSSMSRFKDRVINNQNNEWANFMGIDISKQDDAVARILWWSSFTALDSITTKKEWIESAIAIWKSKWYANYDAMRRDYNFKTALENRVARTKNNASMQINEFEIEGAWDSWVFWNETTEQPQDAWGGNQGNP